MLAERNADAKGRFLLVFPALEVGELNRFNMGASNIELEKRPKRDL